MASESSSRLEEHLDTLVVVHPGESGNRNGRAAHEFRASAYVLARWSPFFKAALSKDWFHGEFKRVELCDDPQAVGHLLKFMHSMGSRSKLPHDVESLVRLLPTAHALEVEACVAAAAARLEVKAGELEWEAAVQALSLLEGRHCAGRAAERQMGDLQRALLGQLLKLLGKLDDALNDEAQRQRFCQLPLTVLEGLFQSKWLQVECEETAFCGFAHWMHRQSQLTGEERAVAAVCILGHIRFGAMRASSVVNYWHAYRWFRDWDPEKHVLLEALVCMAESSRVPPCQPAAPVSSAMLQRRMRCPLLPRPLHYTSTVEVGQGGEGPYDGSWRYWAGAWWRTQADKVASLQGPDAAPTLGLCLVCCLPPGAEVASDGLVGPKAVGPTIAFKLAVGHAQEAGGDATWWRSVASSAGSVFRPLWQPASSLPSFRNGWDAIPLAGAMPDGSPIRWDNFRQPGSPIVRNGRLTVQVTASWVPI